MLKKMIKNQKGFTLVELMVVIAILGVLAAIAVPKFSDATTAANTAKVAADLRTIDSAIAMYQATNGTDPAVGDLTAGANANLAAWPSAPLKGKSLYVDGAKATLSANSSYTLAGAGSAMRSQISYNDGADKTATSEHIYK